LQKMIKVMFHAERKVFSVDSFLLVILASFQLRSYLNEKVAAPVKKTELTTGGIRCADHATPSIRKSWY
jgi:hypothetical protein